MLIFLLYRVFLALVLFLFFFFFLEVPQRPPLSPPIRQPYLPPVSSGPLG